ncbi:hypothetical protein LTR08_002754 [Meristemomyces frigidus]|nr:hypothetical protein LTR08_002754 [Meristemomyces frigidus]
MAAGELVLLTGATGHVGFAILRSLIDYGYTVRVVLRNDAKADLIRSQPSLKAKPDQLTFVSVPDFSASGAFDSAVRDAKYIVHVASPIPGGNDPIDDLEASFVIPAVRGTLNVLSAAEASNTVKRVVITSSAVVLVPVPVLLGQTSSETFSADYRAPPIPAPYNNMPMVAYVASKTAALAAAEDFVKTEKPGFDVIHIHPSYVEGRDDLTTTVAGFRTGTNRFILDIVTGNKEANPLLPGAVHVEDLALAHVKALNPSVPGNMSFILNAGGFEWNDAVKHAVELFPQAFADGLLSDGVNPVKLSEPKLDTSTTETVLGVKARGYKEMVESVVGHYLEVLEKEKGRQ